MTFGSALLHLIIYIPRVEALRTSTLGYGNATSTELPRVRSVRDRSPIPTFPKGKEPHPTASNTAGMDSRPLGRVGEGLSVGW